MKKRTKFILFGLGSCLMLMLLLPVALRFYAETRQAQQTLQAKINQKIPGKISWEEIRFSLLIGKFEFKNVLLKGPSGEELAGFDRLFADFSYDTLIRGDLTVAELILENPRADIRTDAEGKLNITKAFPPSKPAEKEEKKSAGIPFNIVVNSLKIIGGNVRYESEAQGLKIAAQNISLTGSDADFRNRKANLVFEIGKGDVESPKIRTKLDGLRLQANLKDGRLDPLVLNVGTDMASLKLSGNVANILSDERVADLALDIEASLDAVRENLSLKPELTGQAKLHLTAKGTPNNPQASLLLSYGGGNLAGNQIDKIELDAGLKDRYVTVSHLKADAASGNLELQGTADLQQAFAEGFLSPKRDLGAMSYKLSLKENHISLAELLIGKGVKGIVNADISLDGKGISPKNISGEVSLAVQGEQISASNLAAPVDLNVKAEAGIEQGLVTVRNAQVAAGKTELRADGRFDLAFQDILAKLTLSSPSLADTLLALGVKDVTGAIDLKADVSGPAKRPVFDCSLRGDQLRFRNIAIGNVRISAGLDSSGMLKISELNLENQGSVLQGGGSVQLFGKEGMKVDESLSSDVSLSLQNIEATDFLSTLPIKGIVSGKIKLEGSIRQPKGFAEISGKNFDFGVQKLKEIKLNARLDGEKLGIAPLQVTVAAGEMLEATGWISLKKDYLLHLKSKGISLQNIDKIREKDIAKGKILLDVSGQGNFGNPQAEGDITLKELQYKGKPVEDFQLHLGVKDYLAQVSGKLNFDVVGDFHLQKKDFSATVVFNETNLEPYLKLADQKDFGGKLSGKIEAKGNAADVKNIRVSADLSKLDFLVKGQEMISSQNFKADFEAGKVSLPGSRLRVLKDGHLDVKGMVKLGGPLAIQADGDIPLQVVSAFAEDLSDVTGKVLLSARVKGTMSAPDIQATVNLEKAGMTVPGLSQQLHDLNGRIQITPDALTVENLKGQLDTGRLDLTGKIALKSFQPARIDAKLKAESLPVQVPETLDMLLNADLQLSGTPEKTALTGDAVILEGTYSKDVNLSLLEGLKGIGRKKRETAPQAKEMKQPFLKNMSLDISVKRRNPFLVENNLANLEIAPDLRVYGKLNQPLVSGRAEIESGTITYQKKEFDISKGLIDFVNPYKIEPTLDIESEVNIRSWKITLHISGTPDQLSFKLSSDPTEEDGDILSLLLFGKKASELSGGGTGGSSQFPTQMMTEMIEEKYGKDIKKAAGLDILEVKFQGDGTQQDPNSVTVTVGKELSRRLAVKYTMESKSGETLRRASAEYKFLENLLLTGFQDDKGKFGGELLFRMEFR
ncbi:MAG: hypothetical protein BWK80_32120 [Desulfobacteraceae bacterium IS3]|nr:MAG: hypothetical protein BWK80_32120 [Desulfobacteraceae bacterium IS3]